MRILLLTHGLPPDSVGGVEQHVDGLAQALVAAGHDVSIYARTSRPGEPLQHLPAEDWHGATVTRVIYRWEDLTSLHDLYVHDGLDAALRDYLAASGPFDVAHVHHLTGLSTGSVQVLRDAGIPVVLTLHDYWMMCPRGQMWHRDGFACAAVEPNACAACLQPTFGHWLQDEAPGRIGAIHDNARATLGAATRLLTPSARTIPFYERLGVAADRIHVVENGVDTLGLEHVPPPQTEGPLRIGYLGTLIPSKGLDVLVRAVRTLPAGTATLAIHGNAVPYHGDEGFLTRAFQELSPEDAVVYHGPYTTADLPQILSTVDVLVAPAQWHEAFGLTVREALAAGRPVVVSRVGGLQDAVADGVEGLVVEPGDVPGLARALSELVADRARVVAMSQRARSRSRGFAAMAEDLIHHYAAASKT